ncbi:hypothetical protein IWX64_003276 [Arthrobacter sp. CAN_A212]|nr:hypothetical protein [Arthrobacter sp. CAN_C5]
MNLVTVTRSGRDAVYALTDEHVAHVINDAIAHTGEAPSKNELVASIAP